MKDNVKRTVTIPLSPKLFEHLERIRTERLWNKKTVVEYYLNKGLEAERLNEPTVVSTTWKNYEN